MLSLTRAYVVVDFGLWVLNLGFFSSMYPSIEKEKKSYLNTIS